MAPLKACLSGPSRQLSPRSCEIQEWGVETSTEDLAVLRPGGIRACPAGLPVKAYAPIFG